ncbi:MAG TPA: CpXC domain-containing protein [Ktedonobacterales bacterium]
MPRMPRSTEMTFTCPCGTTFSSTVYSTVNVTLEPELLYKLLFGSLNTPTCPNCGRRAASAQPFLYHDMARGLFAYVHPSDAVEDEDREALLAELRKSYSRAVEASERILSARERQANRPPAGPPTVRRRSPGEDLSAQIEPEAPPMQVIFGVDSLVALVDSLLDPEERLGKIALSTRSTDAKERERLRTAAEGIAKQMGCLVEPLDDAEEYTVWVYGPRARIGTIAEALGR